MQMCTGFSGSNGDSYSVSLTHCQTAQMFALLFKCLELLLLLLHGEAESQHYNHSIEGSHTHLCIYLFIYLFNLAGEFPSWSAHFDAWPWSCSGAPWAEEDTEKLAFQMKVWVEMKCREDSSNVHLCDKKGLRLEGVTKMLSHTDLCCSAWKWCPEWQPSHTLINYVYIPAHTLNCSRSSFDAVVCLSGFEKAPLAFEA